MIIHKRQCSSLEARGHASHFDDGVVLQTILQNRETNQVVSAINCYFISQVSLLPCF